MVFVVVVMAMVMSGIVGLFDGFCVGCVDGDSGCGVWFVSTKVMSVDGLCHGGDDEWVCDLVGVLFLA